MKNKQQRKSCEPCRHAKKGCVRGEGEEPCQRCSSKGLHCHFELSEQGNRYDLNNMESTPDRDSAESDDPSVSGPAPVVCLEILPLGTAAPTQQRLDTQDELPAQSVEPPHNKMSVMEALRRWHQSKSFGCPSCKHILIIDEKNIQIIGDTNIISILHKVCREANPKNLHVCTQCGSRSKYSKNKLITHYCKCTNKDNETPSANSAHSTEM